MSQHRHSIILTAIAVITIAFFGCSESPPNKSRKDLDTMPKAYENQRQTNESALKYNIIDRELYDAPIKTQVELHVQINGTITEANLRQLLQNLYLQETSKTSFNYHSGRPTHVFIYLYTSRDHFDSGMGQWIGMLSKVGDEDPVKISIKSDLIEKIKELPKTIHGLDEAKRREIFVTIVKAEDKSHAEAEAAYPLPNPSQPGYSQDDAREQLKRQAAASNKLLEIYENDIAKQYNITLDQLKDIGLEGVTNNWPMPK
ncbi:MAG: hypothetical protein KQH53_06280 [Desulfarculaceae bacterium]|nr:hypothetical protein [Desulfarculaceae bacterium]